MSYKGQAELIIIVALMIVIGVVVVSQMGLLINHSETPDVRNARESVEGLISSAVLGTLEAMSDQGGYVSTEYSLGSVTFNGEDVPYWQRGGQVSYPDLVSNMQAGVQSYLDENREGFEQNLPGISLGQPLVGTPVISRDRITLSVTMPVTYKETQFPQPFTVSVDSSLGEIYEFSKGFAAYEVSNRPLEYYTLSSMMLSPLENGHHKIPVYEVLVGCGDHIFASSWDVMPEVETAIVKTLSNIYMPGRVPQDTLSVSTSPKYALVPINGKRYEDLEVSFLLPDDFRLDHSSFRMDPDPAAGMAEAIPMMAECVGKEPVSVDYSLDYPAIVMIPDPKTGNAFQFAVQVLIRDNSPADWASTPEELGLQAEICSDMSCILDLDVRDSSGNPLEGAAVSFMGCHLGRTDSSGYLATLAPCGSGSLHVSKQGFGDLLESKTSGELEGTAILLKQPVMNVMLHKVIVQDLGSDQYMVYSGPGNIEPIAGERVHLSFRSAVDFEEYSFYSTGSALTVSTIPAGAYYVTGTLTSPDFRVLEGAFGYPFLVTEDLDGQDLHVYIPATIALRSITDEVAQRQKVAKLTQVLYECGIGPMTSTEYANEEACAVTLT